MDNDRRDLAFPLNWPAGWPRTLARRDNIRFKVSFARARNDIVNGLRVFGARDIVISSNVPLRGDGLPYADGEMVSGVKRDPGVAVYWTRKGRPFSIACDQWRHVRHNLRSIGLAVEGFRAIERSGASNLLERAFSGFSALPSSIVTAPPRDWWVVLDLRARPASLDEARAAYLRMTRAHHPDVGGSVERMAEINLAWEQAESDYGGSR
jgi:hypothetical protein